MSDTFYEGNTGQGGGGAGGSFSIVREVNPLDVWIAIEAELERRGDSDIKAGLAWLKPEDQLAIANAAIAAVWKVRP